MPPPRGGRVASFRHAIASSNNQCFARYAVSDLGEEALLEEIRRVGFLDPPAAGHAPGRVLPVRGQLSLGHLGSGIAGSFITPLSAARLAATLAEGELVHPHWIARVRDIEGNPLLVPRRPKRQPGWAPEIAAALREVLVGVTEHGTARSAFHEPSGRPRLGPVRVAGKTGTVTGRDPAGRYQWFIGVAPAEAPRVAIATVVVRDSGHGHHAARIAAAALAEVFCDEERCDPAIAERLHSRAAVRNAEVEREVAEWKLNRQREIEERERSIAFERARQTAAAHTVLDLDRPPSPIGVAGLEFPRRLRRSPVDGEIVLLLEISEEGKVLDLQVASSDLPEFTKLVSRQVSSWRFTPPTRAGRPVKATARLPIPIHIN
jgi:TonB family protein